MGPYPVLRSEVVSNTDSSHVSNVKYFHQLCTPFALPALRREVTALLCPIFHPSTPSLIHPSLLLRKPPPSLLSTAFMLYYAIPTPGLAPCPPARAFI